MAFVGDVVPDADRDALLNAAGCRPWKVLRREAEHEANRVETSEDELLVRRNADEVRERELEELTKLMGSGASGELGSQI